MSSPKRHSPRAAIREWLSHTDATHPPAIKQNADVPSKRHEGDLKKRYPVGHPKGPRPEAKEAQTRPNEGHHEGRRSRGDQPTDSRGGRNVAEQLGLHAPFRSFASRSADPQTEPESENQRRKRKRPSSSAFFLEPAVYPNPSHGYDQDQKSLEPKKSQHQKQNTHIELSSRASSTIVDSPEKPAKTYGRRPRHKTREDRYDLQKDRKPDQTKEVKSKARDKSKKKRKGVQKSGAALMQNFSAGNVETDRLTLKPSVPVGLFGKGRASSPIRRKGLPDLTFSEVNFLNHGRGNQEDNVRSKAKSKRRKEAKAADAEAEFSSFFASSKDTSRAAIRTIEHGSKVKGRKSVEVTEEQDQSSLPPVDLPEKPFLGFGSCGPGHVSPVMPSRSTIPNDYNRLLPTHWSLSDRSTTYFTWSRSSPSRHTLSERQRQSRQTLAENRAEARRRQSMEVKSRERSSSSQSNSPKGYEVRRTPPSRHERPCKAMKEHGSIDRHASVPESIHDLPNKISAGADHTNVNSPGLLEQQEKIHEICARDDPLPPEARGTGTDLASLLASQNRSELLGAVLDLLMGKTSAHNANSRQSPKRSEIAGSKGEDYLAVPEVVPKSQMQYEAYIVHSRGLPHADSNLPLHPERPASARQIPDMQRARSSGSNKSKKSTPTTNNHSRTPVAMSKTNKPPEPLHPSQHAQLLDRPSLVTGSRPNTSNAWTGYRNIYQEQFDMQTRTVSQGKNYEDAPQDSSKRRAQADSQASHPLDEESHPGWVYRHHPHVLEEDPLHEPYFDHRNPLTHETHTPELTLPETLDAMDELYPQQQYEPYGLDQKAHHDFVPEPGDHLPFEQSGDGLPGAYLNEDAGVSHESEPPAFLGARGSWNLGQEERFPSWDPCQRPNTLDRTFESANHGDKGDGGIEAKVPLGGFWKPHRLY
ncbi:MAG: hypothetical protein L6R42_005619 [Xanthoria sp. 1 TBL-2021]|nr:MAG: hypothetical protein L6R42_005619 [Xanthoria sp. 1 TBL-2021]